MDSTKTAVLITKSIRNLPKLGLYSKPSPYVIIKSSRHQSTTSIAQESINPDWNHQCQVSSTDELENIQFYVYNSNSNSVDELLAYGQIQFESLMTNVLTESDVRLKDAKGNNLRCFIQIEHYNQNPSSSTNQSKLSPQLSAVRINLLRISAHEDYTVEWLENNFRERFLTVDYGNQSKQMDFKDPQATFRYCNSQELVVSLNLQTVRKSQQPIVLQNKLLLGNLTDNNSCMRCTYHHKQHTIFVLMNVSIIEHGFLPEKCRIMTIELEEIGVHPKRGDKQKPFGLVFYSVHTPPCNTKKVQDNKLSNILTQQHGRVSLYIQNGTNIWIQYFDGCEKEEIYSLSPTSVYDLSVNSLNWSVSPFSAVQGIKMYDSQKGTTTSLRLKFIAAENEELLGIICPIFREPEFFVTSGRESYQVKGIKINGAYLSEILAETTAFRLVYVSDRGKVYSFPPFQIKKNSPECINSSQLIIRNKDTRGWLYLVTLEHNFADSNSETPALPILANHYIFKLYLPQIHLTLAESPNPIQYSQKFLGYAKKISLTKVCKKYDQMMRDRTLELAFAWKQLPQFQPGYMTLHNAILHGTFPQIKLTLLCDSNQFFVTGSSSKYLLSRPSTIKITRSGLFLKLESGVFCQELHANFQQLFGTPSENHVYKIVFPFTSGNRLELTYSYSMDANETSVNEPIAEKDVKNIEERQLFNEETFTSLKLGQLTFNETKTAAKGSYMLRVSKGRALFESMRYSPNNDQICFADSQRMDFGRQSCTAASQPVLKNNTVSENRYIFFNLYSYTSQQNEHDSDSQQQNTKLVIYSGHFDVRNFIGRGCYEVVLVRLSQQQPGSSLLVPSSCYLSVELLNDKPIKQTWVALSFDQLKATNSLSAIVSAPTVTSGNIFKSILKYYLMVEVECAVIAILEYKVSPTDPSTLLISESGPSAKKRKVLVRRGENICYKLFSCLKTLTQQSFHSENKELLATCQQLWTDMSPCSKPNTIELGYIPSLEHRNRYNPNTLAMIQSSLKVRLSYYCQVQQHSQAEVSEKPPLSGPDLEVVHNAAAVVSILDFMPCHSDDKVFEYSLTLSPSLPQGPYMNSPQSSPVHRFHTFSKSPLNFQTITQLINAQICLNATKMSKINSRFVKSHSNKVIGLENKHLKINDKYGTVLSLEGIGIIRLQIMIVRNKFTSYCNGILKLQAIRCRVPHETEQVRQVEIYSLESIQDWQLRPSLEAVTTINLEREKTVQLTNQGEVKTSQISHCMMMVLMMQDKTKLSTVAHLAKMAIDKLSDKSFHWEWLVSSQTGSIVQIEFDGAYTPNVSHDRREENVVNISYSGNPKVTVEYRRREDIMLLTLNEKMGNVVPARKIGSRTTVELSNALDAQKVYIVLQQSIRPSPSDSQARGKAEVQLQRVSQNGQLFVLNAQKEPQISTISFLMADGRQVSVEQLQRNNFSRRFLIGRDAYKLAYLTQQPYAIADIPPQSQTLTYTFHRIQIVGKDLEEAVAHRKHKIMWMSNNQNDEILTRCFGLYVKHGSQCKVIRVIDENGEFICSGANSNDLLKGRSVTFGYQPDVDEIELYLYIHHELNHDSFELTQPPLEQLLAENWMKMLPVSHGRINLSAVSHEGAVLESCSMRSVRNTNETLDHSLDKVIIRSQISCLGAINMNKRNWGFITLQFIETTPIELECLNQTKQLLYFIFTVENSKKEGICEVRTQARELSPNSIAYSRSNVMRFEFIQREDQFYNLRIVCRVISLKNDYVLFEKRSDLSQYLSRPSNVQSIQIGVKPNQSLSSILLKPIQLTFSFANSNVDLKASEMLEGDRVRQRAMTINKVDVVAFQCNSIESLIEKLLICGSNSHLIENMNEAKESIIYANAHAADAAKYDRLFCAACLYLQVRNDSRLVLVCLEIITLFIVKFGDNGLDLFARIKESVGIDQYQQFIAKLYKYIQLLTEADEVIDPQLKCVSFEKYESELKDVMGIHVGNDPSANDKQQQARMSIRNLDKVLNAQRRAIYTAEEIIKPPAYTVIPAVILLIRNLCTKCPEFQRKFEDLQEIGSTWNDAFLFKDKQTFIEYIHLIEGALNHLRDQQQSNQYQAILSRVLDIGLERDDEVLYLVELWGRMQPQQREKYAQKISGTLSAKMFNEKITTKQGIKEVITVFDAFLKLSGMYKISLDEQWLSAGINNCIAFLKRCENLEQIGWAGQFAGKLKSMGHLGAEDNIRIISELKQLQEHFKEKTKMLFIGNLINRLTGKSVTVGAADQGDKSTNKNRFYRKFLITS